MGYFSNGAEARDFEEQFCRRCIHYGPEEGPGCPVWAAHFLFAYEECGSGSAAETILDMLITREADGDNKCELFVAAPL